MIDRYPLIVEAQIVDDPICDHVVEATLDANETFNARRDAQQHHNNVEQTLRQTRNATRIIALLVTAIVAILLSGCSDERTWAAVERDRHRIVNELTKAVPTEHHDSIQTIVFARPRQQPETVSRGFVQASARVDQERIALAAAEAKFRAELRSVTNPAGMGELPDEIRAWQGQLQRARRMLLIAELAPSMNEWGPILDQLIHEELAGTPSQVVPRTLPASESLRLERARAAFATFLRAFEEVQP